MHQFTFTTPQHKNIGWFSQNSRTYRKYNFILCQQVAISERQKCICFHLTAVHKAAQHLTFKSAAFMFI